MECIQERTFVESEEEEQEQPLVLADTPEEEVWQSTGGTAVDVSAAVVGVQVSDPGLEWVLPGEASCGGMLQSVVPCNQLRQ